MTTMWMGIVENSNDPLKLGRCQVRIHGVHSENKNLVPTEDLPWCTTQHPPNSSQFFSTLKEGDYVQGIFPAGISTQQPVITGIIPGFLAKAWEGASSLYYTKRDMPDGLPSKDQPGVPTVGALARGDVENSKIAITNSVLTHSCDFRFFVGANINLGQLVNPVTAIQDAIRAGKNRAAQATGIIMRQIATKLRQVINAILESISISDKSGEFSKLFSVSKDIYRQVNYYIKRAAEMVEMASFYYNFVKDITQIVDYLKKLPAYLASVVEGCIAQFLNSVNTLINQLKTIPGLVSNNIDAILGELQSSSQSVVSNLNTQAQANTSNTTIANTSVSEIISVVVYNPDEAGANLIMNFINQNFANANVVLENATANSYSKLPMQSP